MAIFRYLANWSESPAAACKRYGNSRLVWSGRICTSIAGALCIVAWGMAGCALAEEPIRPLPVSVPVDIQKASLGQRLFVDKRLAQDGSVSCASCHIFSQGGALSVPKPIGANGRQHALNSPSIFNTAFGFKQLWSGGVDSVEAVVDRVIQSPMVFASSWDQVLSRLATDAKLTGDFRLVYPTGLTATSARDALAEYTRSLITPNAPFDRYLRGDPKAITAEEKAGYSLFKQYGCVACHQGVNVGGNMYQKFGVMEDYFQRRGKIKDADLGRFNFTRREDDRFVFKVPSLRNVALSAPYFHDGTAATLDEAVDVMFRVQLGRPSREKDRALIVKFLNTLTGEIPPDLPDSP
jgi:cytochrome c peroxidase